MNKSKLRETRAAKGRPERQQALGTVPLSERNHTAPGPVREQATVVEANIDVGFGNTVFIRGEGDGLSWDKGRALRCIEGASWVWSTDRAKDTIVFKLLLNDMVWAKGEDLRVEAGNTVKIVPSF